MKKHFALIDCLVLVAVALFFIDKISIWVIVLLFAAEITINVVESVIEFLEGVEKL